MSRRKTETQDVYTVRVAGASHRQGALSEVTPGSACLVELDEHNPYDENAVRLSVNGAHIGFVPRDAAAPLAQLMRAGAAVTGVVESVGRSRPDIPLGAIVELTVDYAGVR